MKLVVGDYLEVAGGFDGICMVDSSFQKLTETYPSVINTVQQYFAQYGKRVFNCGGGTGGVPRIIFLPLDDAIIAKTSCEQITAIADKPELQLKSVLIPKPWNYKDIKGILESMLDDRFILISDDANDIPSIKQEVTNKEPIAIEPKTIEPKTTEPAKKVLECSSAGDKRFSAMYAIVEYMGKEDTIENHYQGCKRFFRENTYVAMEKPKGNKVDACEIFGGLYEADTLTAFYTWLWWKYFREHDDLLTYASGFDDFADKFKGKSVNCQADVIKSLVHSYDEVCDFVSPICNLESSWLSTMNTVASDELPFGIEEETTPVTPSEPFNFEVEDNIQYKPITVCVTGHRPDKLWGYSNSAQYAQLQNKIYQCIEHFYSAYNVTRFINGGAQGADQLFFGVVDYFRQKVNSIENVVYIPFIGQETTWRVNGSMFSQDDYNIMLSKATDTVICDDSFKITSVMTKSERDIYRGKIYSALMNRNSRMVEDTNYVIGIYNGDINLIFDNTNVNGGTLNCLRKAYKAGKGIVIINPNTLETTRINM